MKTLSVSKIFGQKFGKEYVPKIYIRLILEELAKRKYVPILVKVKEKFGITKNDLQQMIKIENIIVSQLGDAYVIRFNDRLIKDNLSIEQVLDYINDGDLTFRGSNLFNNIIKYVNNNIRTINRYYLMRGD